MAVPAVLAWWACLPHQHLPGRSTLRTQTGRARITRMHNCNFHNCSPHSKLLLVGNINTVTATVTATVPAATDNCSTRRQLLPGQFPCPRLADTRLLPLSQPQP